ncbi:MAG TPA: DNA-processing protein DprA [Pseudonocardiaceae bacterium]
MLFTLGELVSNESAVSVVGSRSASDAGLRLARTVASALIERGITVLSGLAAGIDTAAHRAALDVDGRTVAVIGTGINQSYPAANRQLQESIADKGLVVSQFWPDAPPTKQTFPMRNATMSAYGRATIVIEAGEKSGARIQARLAVEHGRPVILTDSVVQGTTWGSELVGKPGVAWVRGIDEIIAHAVDAVSMGDRVAELLSMVGD